MRNPLKADPTRTTTIRRAFSTAASGRLLRVARKAIGLVLGDYFDLGKAALETMPSINNSLAFSEVLANARFSFETKAEQIERFREFLEEEIEDIVFKKGARGDDWWDQYIFDGYRKGAGRAFEDVSKVRRTVVAGGSTPDYFLSGKDDFFFRAFGTPVARAKVKLLAGRVLTELRGVTDDMAKRMVRELTDGLVQGLGPREVARRMAKAVDISRARAETIARTETIRAHAEGQLDSLQSLGVQEVGVMVEWSTTGDDLVCPLCNDMNGVVLKIEEARGAIPRHPNCRCSFIPANVGEDRRNQVRSAAGIQARIDRSIGHERGKNSKLTIEEQKAKSKWPAAETKIDKKRPKSFV